MELVLPMIIDSLIILLLGGTIFYAARLSHHLKAFRNNKAELEKLLVTLSSQVDKAEASIQGLRESARQSGRDLQGVVHEANAVSEELQIINQSGDRLAARLESVMDNVSPSAQTIHPVQPRVPEQNISNKSESFEGFSIRDSEFEDEFDGSMDENGLMSVDYEDAEEDEDLVSRAEKELYDALRANKKLKTGAGGVS